jgi:ATP-binding cassette subfamily F protein 3
MQEIHRIEENITLLKQWNREKSIKQAESREKRVERLREGLVDPEKDNKTVKFSFSAALTSGNEVLTADDMAAKRNTINYEVVCDFGLRLEKIYV